MTDTSTAAPDRTPDGQFIARLAAMHHSRDRAMSGLRRWMPGPLPPQQLVDVARATEGSDENDYEVRAATGRCFAVYHAGTSRVSYGYAGSSVGRALRSAGSAGQGYGPRNPAIDRLFKRLVEAETLSDLTTMLSRAVSELHGDSAPPHWETLLEDLRVWTNPDTRFDVRLRWSQEFYTTPEKKAK